MTPEPTAPAVRCHAGDELPALREELLDLHDTVYAGTGDPLADRASFAPFLDHWATADGFTCATARAEKGPVIGYAYGAPLTVNTSWWQPVRPRLDPATAAEDGKRTFAVSELLVATDWRGTGTARRLHDAVLDGREEERVTLLTHAAHPKVVALYRTWGYSIVGQAVPFEGAPCLVAMLRPLR